MKPLVGITCCSKAFGPYATPNHGASDTYVAVVDEVVGGVPVLIPANGDMADVATLLARLDGIILTGSPSNVQPRHYDGQPHCAQTPEDARRDAVTLRLIRAAVARRTPVLAICRGFQEMNVALGGSLHQRLQDLPGRLDHSTAMADWEALRNAKAHAVALTPGCWLHRIAQVGSIAVNSLHNQGVDRLAPALGVDAVAPDGTIEAFSTADGAAIGVQWHPEYDYRTDAVSAGIFARFAAAMAPVRLAAE